MQASRWYHMWSKNSSPVVSPKFCYFRLLELERIRQPNLMIIWGFRALLLGTLLDTMHV